MLYIRGESAESENSSYVHIYDESIPIEFFCNGIVSSCLTIVNVICIFITAIIVLKVSLNKKNTISSYSEKNSSNYGSNNFLTKYSS